jgi:acetylglutamate kinase
MSGMFNARVVEDEKMVEDIAKTAMTSKSMMHNSRIVIYDARPYLNAQANRLKKGGYEDIRNYRNSEILFCDIDNIHEVSKVFKKA